VPQNRPASKRNHPVVMRQVSPLDDRNPTSELRIGITILSDDEFERMDRLKNFNVFGCANLLKSAGERTGPDIIA